MVVKIMAFIMLLVNKAQLYSRRLIYDHFTELIGGMNHQHADMEYWNAKCNFSITDDSLNF
jgi:hypothetical protein